jgi:hypothetical protein
MHITGVIIVSISTHPASSGSHASVMLAIMAVSLPTGSLLCRLSLIMRVGLNVTP